MSTETDVEEVSNKKIKTKACPRFCNKYLVISQSLSSLIFLMNTSSVFHLHQVLIKCIIEQHIGLLTFSHTTVNICTRKKISNISDFLCVSDL